jgi:hypothetical protein
MRVVTTLRSVVALFLAAALRAQTGADPVPEANPARPTVSTPATLTPAGYLQFESGSLSATTSPEFGTRIGINQVTKLTVLPRLELFVQTEPYVHSSNSAGGDKEIHSGEVFLGAQAELFPAEGAMPTISVSYIRRLYESPAPELDLGTFRESGILLLSNDIMRFHYDANFIETEQTEHGVRRAARPNAVDLTSARKIHGIGGTVAFYAAVSPTLRRGKPVGPVLPAAPKPGLGCGIRSWVHQHIDALGGIHRLHVPPATSTVAEMSAMKSHARLDQELTSVRPKEWCARHDSNMRPSGS